MYRQKVNSTRTGTLGKLYEADEERYPAHRTLDTSKSYLFFLGRLLVVVVCDLGDIVQWGVRKDVALFLFRGESAHDSRRIR